MFWCIHFLDHNDDYAFIDETNFRAYVWMMQASCPDDRKQPRQNAVLNIASISSIKPESDAYYYGASRPPDLMTRNPSREFSPRAYA